LQLTCIKVDDIVSQNTSTTSRREKRRERQAIADAAARAARSTGWGGLSPTDSTVSPPCKLFLLLLHLRN